MKIYYLHSVLVAIILCSCSSSKSDPTFTNDFFGKKLMESIHFVPKSIDGKIVVVTTEYCQKFNCDDYFKGYEEYLLFYTREEAFMRGVDDFIIIENIDHKTGEMTIRNKRKKSLIL